MNAPTIWLYLMLIAIVPWAVIIHKWPTYLWHASNALAWVGVILFMVLTNAPNWLVIGSSAYGAIAVPISFWVLKP